MKMDAGLDTGPMLSKRVIPIAADETGSSLHDKLALIGAELLIDTLPGYLDGSLTPQPQPQEGVTFAGQIQKEDGLIDWRQPAIEIERLVRAFTPWPGTSTTWNGQLLKILDGTAVSGDANPGSVVAYGKAAAIGTGEGLYLPHHLQLAGRKAVTVEEFLRGQADFVGGVVTAGTDKG